MLPSYHRKILHALFQAIFSSKALRAIVIANLRQDGLVGQINHPEFHFDRSKFGESHAYIELQRQLIFANLRPRPGSAPSHQIDPKPAWQAFGRLTHAAQDFYAHSNYISLWFEKHKLLPGEIPPEKINFLERDIIESQSLRSGNFYPPLELLSFIPLFEPWVLHKLPPDSHAWMNLDHQGRGPLFPYALEAAHQRTRYEYEQILLELTPSEVTTLVGGGYN